MPRDLIVNELSFYSSASKRDADVHMRALVDTIVRARRVAAVGSIRSTVDLNELVLTESYSVAQWRNDLEVDRERRTYFRTITTKYPVIGDDDLASVRERDARTEVQFGGKLASGLGAAYLLEGLALSLPSNVCWQPAWLVAEVLELDDHGEGQPEQIRVRGADRRERIDRDHFEWLVDVRGDIADAAQLWQEREMLFPSLRFCDSTRSQLEGLDRGSPMFRQVIGRLSDLNRYFIQWDRQFDPEAIGFKTTPDSAKTLDQYGAQRTFACPDGQTRMFSWHVRMTPGAWRLYFAPDAASGVAFIGYVGEKPPSANDPT